MNKGKVIPKLLINKIKYKMKYFFIPVLFNNFFIFTLIFMFTCYLPSNAKGIQFLALDNTGENETLKTTLLQYNFLHPFC